jgi:hypothetical protein
MTTTTSSRTRRWGVRALLTLGTVLAVLSVLAVWANRQLLNADNWTRTSSALLEDPAVQKQVSGFAVDQVYANVDVASQIRGALPPRLAGLAGPVAGGLRNVAQTTVDRALDRPLVQNAWQVANHLTAQQLIRVVKGDSKLITTNGNAVILDLRPLVLGLATRLGLPDSLTSRMPESAAKVQVMRSDQLSTLQSAASALGALAIVLPVLALGSLGLAVLLDRDRRRITLLWTGVDLAIAGVAALILRNVIGNHVVGILATTEAVRPAAESTWSIGTQMLVDVAEATIMGAVPLVLAALVAGPSKAAVAIRRAAAPWLRDRPGLVYVCEGLLLLLLVAWGPVPATRKPLPILVMAALLVFGVEVLRRQVAREFPDATAAETRERIVVQARSLVPTRPSTVPAGDAGPNSAKEAQDEHPHSPAGR